MIFFWRKIVIFHMKYHKNFVCCCFYFFHILHCNDNYFLVVDCQLYTMMYNYWCAAVIRRTVKRFGHYFIQHVYFGIS
jgi:hypothetical protein